MTSGATRKASIQSSGSARRRRLVANSRSIASGESGGADTKLGLPASRRFFRTEGMIPSKRERVSRTRNRAAAPRGDDPCHRFQQSQGKPWWPIGPDAKPWRESARGRLPGTARGGDDPKEPLHPAPDTFLRFPQLQAQVRIVHAARSRPAATTPGAGCRRGERRASGTRLAAPPRRQSRGTDGGHQTVGRRLRNGRSKRADFADAVQKIGAGGAHT